MAKTQYLTAPLKMDTMPPGVPYIVGNEAAERFSYYGLNSILVIFMTKYLLDSHGHPDLMNKEQANGWYHQFVSAVYFLPFLGAILADAVFGKFRIIFMLSIVYCFGHLALSLDHTRIGLVIGLLLVALGAGGIKPCVSANVGDQFGATNQHLLPRVFNWFYFSINAGSAASTLLIPWLLEPYKASAWVVEHFSPGVVHWLESPRLHSADIAFGVPGVFMAIATVIFWLGRRKFAHIPPAGLGTYKREIFNRATLKTLGYLFIPVPFVAMFWALWQQNFSSWVEQAERMDRTLFGTEWLSAQIQTVNPVFILIMLPLFSYFVYPLTEKFFRLTPLRKIGTGLFTVAIAFAIVGWIQIQIDAGQKPNIKWQVLAFLVLTAAETLVSPTHLEFSYTQAPKKLKSLVMCLYLVAVSLGNQFTSAVNFTIDHLRKADGSPLLSGANYFFFFVYVMLGTAVLFVIASSFYRGKTYIQDEAETPST